MNLSEERDFYITKLALDLELPVDGVRKIYHQLADDGFIDYDTEKELLLDE